MDQNRDWKPVAALILAGLALFIALSGAHSYGNMQADAVAVPQQIIIQPAAPPSGPAGGTTAPALPAPGAQSGVAHAWGGPGTWRGVLPIFGIFPLLFLGGLIFLAFRVFGRRRHGWGGPGWYGGGPWGSGPGVQAPPPGVPQEQPYQQYPPQYGHYGQYPPPNMPYPPQYPPQYAQGAVQNQPYGVYPQSQQPQQGQQGQQSQGQSNEATDTHGDITRPQGTGD